MSSLGSMFQIPILYLSLSIQGRRFFKKAVVESRRVNKTLKQPVLFEFKKITYFIKTLKVCDKVFSAQALDQLCSDLGRDKFATYARLVSYGWFSLLMWSKMLEAFNLVPDEAAKERCVLFAFMHREWNDLFDNQGYLFKELAVAFDYQAAIPKQLIFLRRFKQSRDSLGPEEHFGKFYQHMRALDTISFFGHTQELAEKILDQVAPFIALAFLYSMLADIPEGLKEAAKPVARWLYMLDELADLEHDQQINRVTYMIMAKEPEKEMWKQYQICREAILRIAPNPDELIKFIKTLTSGIIDARQQGTNMEISFL